MSNIIRKTTTSTLSRREMLRKATVLAFGAAAAPDIVSKLVEAGIGEVDEFTKRLERAAGQVSYHWVFVPDDPRLNCRDLIKEETWAAEDMEARWDPDPPEFLYNYRKATAERDGVTMPMPTLKVPEGTMVAVEVDLSDADHTPGPMTLERVQTLVNEHHKVMGGRVPTDPSTDRVSADMMRGIEAGMKRDEEPRKRSEKKIAEGPGVPGWVRRFRV